MNILFVEGSLPAHLGGVERVTRLLANGFETLGHKCFFAYYLNDDPAISHDIKLKYDPSWTKEEFCYFFISFTKTHHIELIINQDLYFNGLLYYYKIYKNCGGRIINCYHMSPNWKNYVKQRFGIRDRIKNFLFKACYGCGIAEIKCREMYEIVSRFVLLSDSFIDDFSKVHSIKDKSKFCGIPNPLTFPDVSSPDVINHKEKEVLIVSRLVDVHKNITGALRIWKMVEDIGTDWTLRIIGYGEDEMMLKEYSSNLGLKRVSFEGKSSNPLDFYKRAQIFMMTSNFEGFGMTLTESLQNACVPIAFDTYSSLHDIIINGYNGYIINRGDEKCFANVMIKLQNDNALRYKFQLNALDSSRKFTIDSIMQQWSKILYS